MGKGARAHPPKRRGRGRPWAAGGSVGKKKGGGTTRCGLLVVGLHRRGNLDAHRLIRSAHTAGVEEEARRFASLHDLPGRARLGLRHAAGVRRNATQTGACRTSSSEHSLTLASS